jgi:hypothetical protein
LLTNGAAATEWGGPATFENNPTNITWTPTAATNREFQIRAWYDSDENNTYTNTEPHRIIDVKVVDFVKLMLTNSATSNAVIDVTRTDEPASTTNTLYLCEGTNGTAEMTIQGWWAPTNAPSNLFMWEILTNENASASSPQWTAREGVFTNNPVTVAWTNTASGESNRQFLVRGWYDCNKNKAYDSDEPHRMLYVTIIKVEFIDVVPDYSLDSNTDSDNFFLREETTSGEPDSKDLDIYYKILPSGVEVDDVKIKIYKGDTSTIIATLDGEADTSGDYKSGDNLHITWTPTLATADTDPGFYRLQLQVFSDVSSTPICETSIDDADLSTDGWQCPQDCLAVHDLMWKHRVMLNVHEDEIGTPSSIDEFIEGSGNHVREWTGGSTPTVHPVGTIPTSVDSFWDLFDDNINSKGSASTIPTGDLSDYSAAEIAILTTDSGEETVYHSANTTDANNFAFLQFWMFENFSRRPFGIAGMPFNSNVQHEGDMEHCQIAVRLKDTANAVNKAKWILPFGATVSQHYYAQTLKWDLNDGSAASNAHSQDHVEHNNNRLAVYVCLGAHATYFAEDADIDVPDLNSHLGTQEQYDPTPNGAYDVAGPANEISYTMTHVDNVLLGSFQGRWGYLKNGDPDSFSNGPAGPPHRAAKDSSGNHVNLRSRPKDLHNLSRKTSQEAEMEIP